MEYQNMPAQKQHILSGTKRAHFDKLVSFFIFNMPEHARVNMVQRNNKYVIRWSMDLLEVSKRMI